MGRVVTIDGPAGAGKSTVAGGLAGRLGWRRLDTGAMYRAVALAALRAGIDLHDPDALAALAGRVEVRLPPGGVLLDGEDVTGAIRAPAVTQATGLVASSPGVRAQFVRLQRAFAAEYDVVTEGRDQGTVVFPDARRKFYLIASPEERARRRHAELVAAGRAIGFDEVLRDQHERDARDAARAIAPMRPAPDALVVDTTGMALDEVVGLLEAIVRDAAADAWAVGHPVADGGPLAAPPRYFARLWVARSDGSRRILALGRTAADARRAAEEVDGVAPGSGPARGGRGAPADGPDRPIELIPGPTGPPAD